MVAVPVDLLAAELQAAQPMAPVCSLQIQTSTPQQELICHLCATLLRLQSTPSLEFVAFGGGSLPSVSLASGIESREIEGSGAALTPRLAERAAVEVVASAPLVEVEVERAAYLQVAPVWALAFEALALPLLAEAGLVASLRAAILVIDQA